jgi:hypothetical protein
MMMRRSTLAALAAVVSLTVAIDTASAGSRKRRNASRDDAQSRAADKVRADSLDPSRELKYPDWARKALAPKTSGGRS